MSEIPSTAGEVPRVALLGRPGAGKSTAAKICHRLAGEKSISMARVSIAAPLYDMQKAFFRRLGVSVEQGRQDGKLLNFFGAHFREVSADFLLAEFAFQCEAATVAGASMLVCDDARPMDIMALKKMGFVIVEVLASPEIRLQRRRSRGDVTSGDDNHSTELGYASAAVDKTIVNESTINDLECALSNVLRDIVRKPWSQKGNGQLILNAVKSMAPQIKGDLCRYISDRYREERHQIASVLVAADGRRYYGVHIEAMVGRASSCAETSALEKFCDDGQTEAIILAAIRHPKPSESHAKPRFVAPCGLCRELLSDYVGNPYVLIEDANESSGAASINEFSGPAMYRLADLLPAKYRGTKWSRRANMVSIAESI